MDKKNVSIIGTGALGGVLARALNETEWTVKSLYNRSSESVESLTEELDVKRSSVFPSAKQDLGQVIFLTVPDGVIEETAVKLAALDDDFSGYIVAHCSGSKSSSVLKAIQEKGAKTASFHPLQTFVATSKPSDLNGIYFDIEGQNKAISLLRGMAEMFGAQTWKVTPKAKPYLHAAGVIASNYVVALMESAGRAAVIGGIDRKQAEQALLPLMQKSLANISKSDDLPEALSGPIARGDVSTVSDHLELLKQDEGLLTLYKKLGEVLVQMLNKKGEMSTEKIREMTELLSAK